MCVSRPNSRFWFLVLACAWPATVLAQGTDVEPNHPCPIAQDIGAAGLPFQLTGNLETVGGVSDIDFFRFSDAPGELVRADLRGASTGVGSLSDPLLGLFDADCNFLDLNDDAGSLDSRLNFRVPASGVYVLAATAFPDFGFTGTGEGSYRLTIDRLQVADSIGGRLINARDGSPLSGDAPTSAYVQLFRCNDGSCFEFVGSQVADSGGFFRFDFDANGNPLLTGTYQIQANANGFEFLATGPFELLANQALDLGDIALTPFRLIGSVSGRVVDALDGMTLSGIAPPFAVAVLERCEEFGCYGLAATQPDDNGGFRFDGVAYFLAPGSYRLTATADGYLQTTTPSFDVGEQEDVDLGDVDVTPVALQFGDVLTCEIPPGGGVCEYGIELRNRGPRRFKGSAWSVVDYFPNAAPFRPSRFQVGKAGTSNPMPERLNLRVGESVPLRFQLEVPAGLPEGSTLCASVNAGTGRNAHFNSTGDRFLFCAVTRAGAFEVLTEKQGRIRSRELKRQAVR